MKPPIRDKLYPAELEDVCDWITQFYGAEALESIPQDVLEMMNTYGEAKRQIIINIFNSIIESL